MTPTTTTRKPNRMGAVNLSFPTFPKRKRQDSHLRHSMSYDANDDNYDHSMIIAFYL